MSRRERDRFVCIPFENNEFTRGNSENVPFSATRSLCANPMFRLGLTIWNVVERRSEGVWRMLRGYKTSPIDVLAHPEQSLASVVPDVLRYWDSERNGDLDPKALPFTYRGELWWRCPKGADHSWKTRNGSAIDAVNHRFRSMEGEEICNRLSVLQQSEAVRDQLTSHHVSRPGDGV